MISSTETAACKGTVQPSAGHRGGLQHLQEGVANRMPLYGTLTCHSTVHGILLQPDAAAIVATAISSEACLAEVTAAEGALAGRRWCPSILALMQC